MKKTILLLILSFCMISIFAQKRSYLLFFDFKNGQIISSEDGTVDGVLSLSKGTYDNTMVGVYYKFDDDDKSKKTNPDGTPALMRKNDIIVKEGITEVKFNSENGPITVGDYITTSSTSGVAMKATDKGMILGVALESTSGDEGLLKIRILIQY